MVLASINTFNKDGPLDVINEFIKSKKESSGSRLNIKSKSKQSLLNVPEKNTSLSYEEDEQSFNEISANFNCMITPV